MDTRLYVAVAAASFGLIVLSAVIGNMLESLGVITKENIGRTGTFVVLSFYFALFGVLSFSLVPVLLKTFITMQIRIGNGELNLIKWVREHERGVVYGVWGLFGAGLFIAFALARDEVLRQLK
jgi:hypothetical protein